MIEKWYSPSTITIEGIYVPKLEENWTEMKWKRTHLILKI